MNNPVWITLRSQFGNRAAVAIAGAVCFTIGAGGWAAAERGGNTTKESGPSTTSQAVNSVVSTIGSTVVVSTIGSTVVDSTVVDSTVVDSTTPDTTGVSTSSSSPDSTVATTVANTTVDDSTSRSVPGNTIEDDDDSTSSSAPSSTVDASTSSVPANTASSSSVPTTPLPAPFTKSYTSAGGSITVTWSGAGFSLDAVSPAPGFQAEIDDQDWDRVRVEFDNGDSDWRIEIGFDDGAIREQVTH